MSPPLPVPRPGSRAAGSPPGAGRTFFDERALAWGSFRATAGTACARRRPRGDAAATPPASYEIEIVGSEIGQLGVLDRDRIVGIHRDHDGRADLPAVGDYLGKSGENG